MNIPLFGVVNLPEMSRIAQSVLESGKIASGEYVTQFEAGLRQVVEQENIVSTVDMTSALFLALHLSGVTRGDEVLTTAFACMSTNSAIAHCGATPVWVDVKPKTVEMDIEDLERKITHATKAVVMYHIAGYPGPAAEVLELCRKHGIKIIEDCNNALGAYCDDLPVGYHSDFSIYSFYPNRQINTSEGGALVCKSAEDAARARMLRRFGIDSRIFRAKNGEINPAADIPDIGWAVTMNNLCAALGTVQFESLPQRFERTRQNVSKLTSEISEIDAVEVVPVMHGARSAYWVLLIFVENRDQVLIKMKEYGVGVSALHQRNDAYSGFHAAQLKLPGTDFLQKHILAIPCGWWLNEEQLRHISISLRNAAKVATHYSPTSS